MQPLKLAMVMNVAIDDPVLVCLFDSICESCEGLADSIAKKNESIWLHDPALAFHINTRVIGQGGSSNSRKHWWSLAGVY